MASAMLIESSDTIVSPDSSVVSDSPATGVSLPLYLRTNPFFTSSTVPFVSVVRQGVPAMEIAILLSHPKLRSASLDQLAKTDRLRFLPHLSVSYQHRFRRVHS